jgi:hypothetical protein
VASIGAHASISDTLALEMNSLHISDVTLKTVTFSTLQEPANGQPKQQPDAPEVANAPEQQVDQQAAPAEQAERQQALIDPNYRVIDADAWKSSTSHRRSEQKAHLRYMHIRDQTTAGTCPPGLSAWRNCLHISSL